MNRKTTRARRLAAVALLGGALPLAFAQTRADLTERSLEELMQTGVTSVSKKLQALNDTAAAIHVITQEDIRRSGATRLTEVLAQAPGIEVARIAGGINAVTIRGFAGQWANKLLVLVDGRSIYTQTYSGTYWDMQNLPLEEIDRIEVLRGPGSTLWGVNAVNGVINIITRSARDTEGGLVTVRGGTNDRAGAHLRYGFKAGEHGAVRLYARSERFGESLLAGRGRGAGDDSSSWRTGLRGDWDLPQGDRFTVIGEAYGGRIGLARDPNPANPSSLVLPERGDFNGRFVLGRWQRALSLHSDLFVQAYHDQTERQEYVTIREKVSDFELHHRSTIGRSHELVWGVQARQREDEIVGASLLSLSPVSRRQSQASLFVQDEIQLPWQPARLTLGSRFERSFWGRWEVQPNARLFVKLNENTRVWAALSKAARTPSRIDRDLDATLPASAVNPTIRFQGNPDIRSETVRTAEIGARHAFTRDLVLDASAYVSRYRGLKMDVREFVPNPPMLLNLVANGQSGWTRGFEASATWRVRPDWRLQASATLTQMDLDPIPGRTDDLARSLASGATPRRQFALLSYWDIGNGVSLDARAKYVGALREPFNASLLPNGRIDSYIDLDLRLAWRVNRQLELALIGRNLAAHRHTEFSSESGYGLTERERGVYVKATHTF